MVEVNLATLTCWEYYLVLGIGLSLSLLPMVFTLYCRQYVVMAGSRSIFSYHGSIAVGVSVLF